MAVALLATPPQLVLAAELNDTGITGYADATSNSLASEPAAYPGQDARDGRDALAAAGRLAKTGGGGKGFDFTKLAQNGSSLAAGAALGSGAGDWACTRDNLTGLVWEMKTASTSDFRYFGHLFTWYDTGAAGNGGDSGARGGNTCGGTLAAYANECNTANYVAAANAARLCGFADWRLPRRHELRSLIDYGLVGGAEAAVDANYLAANSRPRTFWSATPSAAASTKAWQVDFGSGHETEETKGNPIDVRLVRGGP